MPSIALPRAPLRPVPTTSTGDPLSYRPSPGRPVRGKRSHEMGPDTHFEPHAHAWAQIAYCASGVIQVSVQQRPRGGGEPAHTDGAGPEVSYIVPPSRAVWIAAGSPHAVTVQQTAELHTLYVEPSAMPAGWDGGSRVIAVSPLLRELFLALEDAPPGERERLLGGLAIDEIVRAPTQSLGVPLPHPQQGDKRLRALCQAVLREPARVATLAERAADAGASERTAARRFQGELGTTYQQWRQQVVLAHALPLLASGQPIGQVATACGYASESAFSAMFRAALGQPPSSFRA